MNELIVKCPINSVSFGNVSLNLMREFFKKKIRVGHFPIGTPDASTYDKLSPELKEWLQESLDNRFKMLDRDIPTLQLWHLNGSENRITPKQYLLTFYELNSPTLIEKKLVDLQDEVMFSSRYAADSFGGIGCKNVTAIPMGFDPDFYETGKTYLKDKVHFGLMGKWEKRKHSAKILRLWAKQYGNNYDYQLTCCLNNPFMKPEELNAAISECLQGERYGNINFLPFLKTNSEVNEFMNAIDIDLSGLSGAEGWNLPSFNATALGKWSIVLNATSHKDWASDQNCILIQPSGKTDAYDGRFFFHGGDFNQGSIYEFNDEEVLAAMKTAESKCTSKNTEGQKLKEEFSYSKTVDAILSRIKTQ
jgi:hypothetical protein